MTRKASPTIALFPEASSGSAPHCVGIARALRATSAGPGFEAPLRQLPARLKPDAVLDNFYLDASFPQPSVAKSDLFIHHGGNNGFCEAPRFGVPSLIMPYCWDGHDNARRAEETGTGDHVGRDCWTEGVLERAIFGLLADDAMRDR